MRKLTNKLLLGGLASLSIVLPSCSESNDPFADVDLIPVKTSKDGKWSMVNDKGEIVYDSEFKEAPSFSVNGVFSVPEKEGVALYKSGGKEPEPINGCDKLKSAGVLQDGLIPVTYPKSRITLINDNGEKKAELMPVSGHEIVKCASAFQEGRLVICTDEDKYGFVDKSGKVVVDPKYDYVANFCEGLAVVVKNDSTTDSGRKISVIDNNGNQQFALKGDMEPEFFNFEGGKLIVKKGDDQLGYLDTKGEYTKLPSKVKRVVNYNDKYVAYMDDNDQYGVMDFEGEQIVRAKYDRLFIAGDYFIAEQDDKWIVLDAKGEKAEGFEEYEDINYGGHFGFLVKEGGKTSYFIDDKGKQKGKEEFYEIGGNMGGYVESDYFDVDGVVNTIINMVTEQGIDKYRLGAQASTMLSGDPDNNLFTSSVTLKEMEKSGYGYRISLRAEFTANVADYDYDYNFNRHSYWNTASSLGMITIDLSTDKEFGLDGYKALVKGFEGRGFKTVKASATSGDKFATLLKKGNGLMLVSGEKDGRGAQAILIDGTIPGMEDNMKAAIDTIAGSDSSDFGGVEETVVEETAVADTVAW